ncbi:unnamed protein product [Arabidopsis halleri]
MEETRALTKMEEAVVRETAETLGLRIKKLHRRISWEEFNERWFKGLCMFCDEPETPDHHLRHKNSGILMIDCDEDQMSHDKELVEIEVATESSETEQRTVNHEATADMNLALLEEGSIPQFQAPIANSEILKSNELREVKLENLEVVAMNKNLVQEGVKKNINKKFEVEGDVERSQKVLSITEICCAHQVFDHKQQQGDSEPLATAPDYDIKFVNMNLQKKMREHGYVNHGKLMSDKERHDEILRRYDLQWKIQDLKCSSKFWKFEFPTRDVSGYNLDRDFVFEMDHWYPYENLETGSFLKTDSISELELESPESNMETNSVAQPQVSIFVLESSHQQKLLGVFDMNTVNKDQQYVLAEALSPLFDNFRSEVAAFCEQSTCVKSHQRKQRLSLKSWMFKYKLGKEWKKRRNISFLCLIVMRALHVDRLQKRKLPLLLKYNCRTVLAEEYNTRCLSVLWIKHKSEQLLSITISVFGFNRASQYQVYLCLFLDKTLASQFQLWYGGEETRYCYKLLLQLFLRVTSTTRQREQFSSAQVRSKLKGNNFKYERMRGAKGLAEGSWLRIILRRIPHLKQPKTWSFKYKQQKNYHDVLVKEPERIS